MIFRTNWAVNNASPTFLVEEERMQNDKERSRGSQARCRVGWSVFCSQKWGHSWKKDQLQWVAKVTPTAPVYYPLLVLRTAKTQRPIMQKIQFSGAHTANKKVPALFGLWNSKVNFWPLVLNGSAAFLDINTTTAKLLTPIWCTCSV